MIIHGARDFMRICYVYAYAMFMLMVYDMFISYFVQIIYLIISFIVEIVCYVC